MTRSARTIRLPALAFALPLALIACGEPAVDQQDPTSLEAALSNGNAGDPALNAALAGQIMVDPTLTQSSNETRSARRPNRWAGRCHPRKRPPRRYGRSAHAETRARCCR
ncbi:hypothetical protein [Sphingomonas sp. Ant20]|uniref:hypothetical protein n=1 Tax=Sphingomonas sp. Ant20 TaxID=104605 RepID=UPI00068DAC9B|nr:hypothetical protein [Sphingomonas sp. Ant20]